MGFKLVQDLVSIYSGMWPMLTFPLALHQSTFLHFSLKIVQSSSMIRFAVISSMHYAIYFTLVNVIAPSFR